MNHQTSTAPRPRTMYLRGVIAAALAVSCSSAEGPAPVSFDRAADVSALVTELNDVIASPAVRSLVRLAPLMFVPPYLSPAAMSAPGRCVGGFPPSAAPGNPPGLTLIPDSLRRRLFALDSLTRTYRWGGDTTGPSQGARFLLEAVDSTGVVTLPFENTGSLSVSDLSAGGQWSMGGQVASPAVSAEFLTMVAGAAGVNTSTSTGRFVRAGNTVTYTDSIREAGLTLTVSALVENAARGWQLRLSASHAIYDPADNTYVFDATFSHGGESVRLEGTLYTYCFYTTTNFNVSVNDIAFGSYYKSTFGQGPITPAGPWPITSEQYLAVFDLLGAQRQVFDVLRALHLPLSNLLKL